jgi:hypothetical protein
MKFFAATFFFVSLAIGLAGCGKTAGSSSPVNAAPAAPDPNAEIRAAVLAHLAHKGTLNLQSFDTTVKQVTIRDDHAQAQVDFSVKNGPGSMSLTYQLQKQNGAWSVIDANPAGSNFSHPGLNGTPPAGGQGSSNDSLADTIRSFTGGAAPPSSAAPGSVPPSR